MKLIGLLLLSAFSTSVFAASGDVYCKDRYTNKPVKLDPKNSGSCISELYMGEVCFTGNRGAVIDLINSPEVDEAFSGTDGESVRSVKYHGRNEISYWQIDEANELSQKIIIERCTAEFFKY